MPRPASGQVLERSGKRGRTFAIRFRAYGARQYITIGTADDGWTRARAEGELANVLADVRRGIWRPVVEDVFEAPAEVPTFHEFAAEWLERMRGRGLGVRTIEDYRWALELHLLPNFGRLRIDVISKRHVDAYSVAKVRERETGPGGLSNRSINATVRILAQILDDAIENELIEVNPARGKKRRLRTSKPKRTWLELDELTALLDAAGDHRPLLSAMALAGLRVSEACALRWRDVDLSRSVLRVVESKTDAGERTVELTPGLLDELKELRMRAGGEPAALVFPTRIGTARDRHNVRARVLLPSIGRANAALVEAGLQPIQEGITNHTLRRTFASLLYEAGASPAYVMAQMGHESSALALEVYAKKMDRQRDTGARVDALLQAADWARMGTSGAEVTVEAITSAAPIEAETAS